MFKLLLGMYYGSSIVCDIREYVCFAIKMIIIAILVVSEEIGHDFHEIKLNPTHSIVAYRFF